MEAALDFHIAHPFWTWIALGGVLLAIEVALGTEYLLWAAASAGVVALIAAAFRVGLPAELGLFAGLTVAVWLASWKFFPATDRDGPDINDTSARVVGREGYALGSFMRGEGRVFVEGKEWAAQAEGEAPADGERVRVVALQDGASLKVRRVLEQRP